MSHCQTRATGSNAQPLIGQRREKLDGKERIPTGFLVNQLGQEPGALRRAAQGVGEKAADILDPEGRQQDVPHPDSGFANSRQRMQKRVRRTNLVVPVRADQQ